MRGSRSYVGLYQAQNQTAAHATTSAGVAVVSASLADSPPPSPPRPQRRTIIIAQSPPPSPSPEALPLPAKPPRRVKKQQKKRRCQQPSFDSKGLERARRRVDRSRSRQRRPVAAAATSSSSDVARRVHRRPITPPRPVRLSEVLRSDSAVWCVSDRKLHAVSKGVTCVDRVPTPFRAARTLFLSGNCLDDRAESISGFAQFTQLRTLSLGCNEIADLRSVSHIARQCPELRILNMKDNPVCKMPFFRLHAIDCTPKLQQLNGVEVSSVERALAPTLLEAADASLRAMMGYRRQADSARTVTRRIRVNDVIARLFHGGFRVTRRSGDPKELPTIEVGKMLQSHRAGIYNSEQESGRLRRLLLDVTSRTWSDLAMSKLQGARTRAPPPVFDAIGRRARVQPRQQQQQQQQNAAHQLWVSAFEAAERQELLAMHEALADASARAAKANKKRDKLMARSTLSRHWKSAGDASATAAALRRSSRTAPSSRAGARARAPLAVEREAWGALNESVSSGGWRIGAEVSSAPQIRKPAVLTPLEQAAAKRSAKRPATRSAKRSAKTSLSEGPESSARLMPRAPKNNNTRTRSSSSSSSSRVHIDRHGSVDIFGGGQDSAEGTHTHIDRYGAVAGSRAHHRNETPAAAAAAPAAHHDGAVPDDLRCEAENASPNPAAVSPPVSPLISVAVQTAPMATIRPGVVDTDATPQAVRPAVLETPGVISTSTAARSTSPLATATRLVDSDAERRALIVEVGLLRYQTESLQRLNLVLRNKVERYMSQNAANVETTTSDFVPTTAPTLSTSASIASGRPHLDDRAPPLAPHAPAAAAAAAPPVPQNIQIAVNVSSSVDTAATPSGEGRPTSVAPSPAPAPALPRASSAEEAIESGAEAAHRGGGASLVSMRAGDERRIQRAFALMTASAAAAAAAAAKQQSRDLARAKAGLLQRAVHFRRWRRGCALSRRVRNYRGSKSRAAVAAESAACVARCAVGAADVAASEALMLSAAIAATLTRVKRAAAAEALASVAAVGGALLPAGLPRAAIRAACERELAAIDMIDESLVQLRAQLSESKIES